LLRLSTHTQAYAIFSNWPAAIVIILQAVVFTRSLEIIIKSIALVQRDELSLGKDVIWKCHAPECQKCGIAVMVETDLTIRCAFPSIVLTRLHGRPYGRPTGGPMYFIEQFFGSAPDGGNGAFESLLLIFPFLIALWKMKRKFVFGWLG
jgi:hypothetical protein